MRFSIPAHNLVPLAIALLAAIGTVAPTQAQGQPRLQEAIGEIDAGRYATAAELLTALIEEDEERGDLHHLLGVTYLKLADLDKAEYFIQRAVSLDPENIALRYDLALVHYSGVRYARAIAVLDQAARLAKARSLPRIQRLRGLAHARLRQWSPAIADLRPAMKRLPDAGSFVQLGRAYLGTGDNREALDAFRRAQTLDPTHGEGYRLASESLVRIAQKTKSVKKKRELYADALEEAESLLSVRPMSWRSWYQAGRAAIGARELDKAEDYLRQVVSERPDYCLAWLNLARVYQTVERADEAVEAIREAEACAPELAPTLDLDALDARDVVERLASRDL
jgi:tetratricopeptide (TPR) repeat protein